MTDQNQTIALELEALIADYKKEQDDIRYYSGGPKQNRYTGVLVGTFLFNEDRILAALRTPAPAPVVGGDVVERLAYGYELMHQAICHMAGTSGGDARWYHDKAKDVFERVSPVFKITSESNAHTPGDCLSGYKTLFAALQAQPTASTAQPVSGDPFDPETDGTDCPSCGGQNTSCPDGCGREPETGELNGTRLETAQPDEVVEAMARAISEAGDCPRESNQTVAGAWWWDTRYDHPGNEFAHECRANDIKLARAAIAAMQQAPVKLDWRAIAKAAGEHGVRYRTNSALMAFFAQIGLTQPQADAAVAVERERCAKIAECAFDDRGNGRSGHHSEMDWTDGYRDGTRAAAAAIRAGWQQS